MDEVPVGFKETEIGIIPEEWEIIDLGNIIEVFDKMRIPLKEKERKKQSKIYPYCGANGVIDFVEDYIFNGEYLLLAEDGGHWKKYEKSSYLMKGKFWVNNHAHVLKLITNLANNNFLMNILNFLDLTIYVGGDSRGKINQAILKTIKVPFPPLSEQKQIAYVLSTVYNAIEKTEAVIQASKELKKSLLKYLFMYGPVPIQEKENVILKETEIGLIPEEWDVVTLENIVYKFVGGGTPSTKIQEYWNGKIHWTTSKKINGIYLREGEKKISEKGLRESSSQLIPKNNLLIGTRVGVGKVAINEIDIAVNQDLTGLLIDRNIFDLSFIAYQISTNDIQGFFKKNQRGTTIKGIPREELKKIKLKIPKLSIQRYIGEILQDIDEKIQTEKNKKATLQQLFNTLLNNLMTGKIRVNHMEVPDA